MIDLSEEGYFSYYNGSGETIPPYGVVLLRSDTSASVSTFGYKKRIVADIYTDTDAENVILGLNSPASCDAGKYGKCSLATMSPTWARIESDSADGESYSISDATYDWVGIEWGPINESWALDSDGTGFILLSAPDLDNNRVLVISKQLGKILRGKLDSNSSSVTTTTVAAGSYGTISRYNPNDDTDTGINDRVKFVIGSGTAGKWYYYTIVGDHYEVIGGQC